jgi:hypothetical protein
VYVRYPDLYPYFRCEVEAPDEDLPYHQHPGSKNLCVLGRSTYNWSPSRTAAWLLTEQVPKVFAAALAADRTAVGELEEHQGEPFSEYYPYAPTMILIDERWRVPAAQSSGTFKVATAADVPPSTAPMMFGVVTELRGLSGQLFGRCDAAVRDAFTGPVLSGCWIRRAAPVREFNPAAFHAALGRSLPRGVQNPSQKFAGGDVQIWAVLFPEEVKYGVYGDGWVFAYHYERRVQNLLAGLETPVSPWLRNWIN